eukprot:scaffold236123_cov14-Tisochrysis_lutea.AAC.1
MCLSTWWQSSIAITRLTCQYACPLQVRPPTPISWPAPTKTSPSCSPSECCLCMKKIPSCLVSAGETGPARALLSIHAQGSNMWQQSGGAAAVANRPDLQGTRCRNGSSDQHVVILKKRAFCSSVVVVVVVVV